MASIAFLPASLLALPIGTLFIIDGLRRLMVATRGTTARSRMPFELVEAKLSPPPAHPMREVARTALVDRLVSAPESVVAISAPAGYGKTSLLRQWLEADSRPFAWVTLDESDNDPVTCLSYLAAAFESVGRLPDSLLEGLHVPEALRSGSMPRLAAAFSSTSVPMVLALDDIHLVSGRESLDAIGLLCDRVPRGSSVVLSGRGEPPLGFGRLRVRGQLFELGVDDLRFDHTEAAALLEAADIRLGTEEIAGLWERSEGWAAGLYLTALAVRSGAPIADVHDVRGDDPYIGGYLREELMLGLDPSDASFLTSTSVLERLSGRLCDAILERTDSVGVLDRLRQSNQFVVPLDRHGEWYRYHHLFRDLLRQELARQGQDRIQTLNRRAAVCSIEAGDPETAIRYAEAAGDYELLDQLIQRLAFPAYQSGRIATVDEWIRLFDDEQRLTAHPAVAVVGGWIHALSGRAEEAERWRRAAERGAGGYSGHLLDGSSLEAWLALLRAAQCPDGPEQMRADAERAVEELGPASMWRGPAQLFLGFALRLANETDSAEREWRIALAIAQSANASALTVQVLGRLALLALDRGDVSSARDVLAQAQAVREPPLGSYTSHIHTVAAMARLALVDGDREAAQRWLVRSQLLRPRLTWALPCAAVEVRLELAGVALALLDEAAVRTLLMEIKSIQSHRPALGVLLDGIARLEEQVETLKTTTWNWAASITASELRVLPLLVTYLTFDEIGERLFISRHTVKSHAMAIYRKLGATSRSEAIERAVELGLLDETAVVSGLKFRRNG